MKYRNEVRSSTLTLDHVILFVYQLLTYYMTVYLIVPPDCN